MMGDIDSKVVKKLRLSSIRFSKIHKSSKVEYRCNIVKKTSSLMILSLAILQN